MDDRSAIDSVIAQIDGTMSINLNYNNGYYINTTPALSDGQHSINIYASDVNGNMNSSDEVQFVIAVPPQITVTAPQQVFLNETANLTVTITDENPLKYAVYRNGTLVETGSYTSSTPFNVSIDTSTLGTWNYTVEANDTAGNSNSTSVIVEVVNKLPVAEFTYTPSPPVAGVEITFNASASYDPDGGSIVSYDWEFGDGNAGSGVEVNHIYSSPGTYVVNLTVRDDENGANTTSAHISVLAPDLIVESLTATPSSPTVNQQVTISVKINNTGDADATAFNVTIYVNNNPIKEERVSSLKVGENRTITASWTPASAGTYTIRAVVDSDNEITEANENNNESSTTVTVKVPAPKGGGWSRGTISPISSDFLSFKIDIRATIDKYIDDDKGTGIVRIHLEPDGYVSGTLTITPVDEAECGIPEGFKVYKILKIDHDFEVKKVEIDIKIPESWFEESGVEDVKAFKCPSTEIETELSAKYSTYRVYTLKSDGFSTWVVGGYVEKAEAGTVTTSTTTTTTTIVTTTTPPTTTPQPEKPTPGFEAVIAIVGLLAVAYILRRR